MITITISSTELQYIKKQASLKEWGGQSAIRGDDRNATLSIDNLIGCIGEFAGCVYLYGNGAEFYKAQEYSQELRRKGVSLGDGGQDIIGLNLDFKTSKQHEDRSPLKHWLPVRPNEFKPDWVYMLLIVLSNDELIGFDFDKHIDVAIVGWASSDMFPKHTAKDGVFSGAYCLPASKLVKPMPVKWSWRLYG